MTTQQGDLWGQQPSLLNLLSSCARDTGGQCAGRARGRRQLVESPLLPESLTLSPCIIVSLSLPHQPPHHHAPPPTALLDPGLCRGCKQLIDNTQGLPIRNNQTVISVASLFKCIYNDAMMLISWPEPARTEASNALALEKIIMPVITKQAANLCTSPPHISKIHFISFCN